MEEMEDSQNIMGGPIPSRSALAEQVAQRLLSLIHNGMLQPGQKLPPERVLAENLGVSRPSLREALRALALLGIIDKRQGEGVFVSNLDPEEMLAPLHFFISLQPFHLDALFEARIMIEGGITRMAAERLEPETLTELQQLIVMGREMIDSPKEFLARDIEFHMLIAKSANNPFLERVMQSLHVLGKLSRESTAQVREIREQTHADHIKILEALKSGDGALSGEAMKNHLQNVQVAYRTHDRPNDGE